MVMLFTIRRMKQCPEMQTHVHRTDPLRDKFDVNSKYGFELRK